MRGGVTTEQLQSEVGEPVALDQTGQPQQRAAADDGWQKHLEDPRLLNAVQQHIDQATTQANQAIQAANANAIYAANSALVGLGIAYPELSNVTAQQLPVALQVIAQQNPQRAQDIVNHVRAISDTVQRGVQAQQAQQQQQYAQWRKNWNSWAATQDAHYEAYANKVPAAERQAIEEEARRMVLEGGADRQSVALSWHTSPELRSAQAQRLLFDAARWRLGEKSRESARRKKNAPVPHIQRPGSPLERSSDEDYRLRALNKGGGPLSPKEAAALVIARRQAATRGRR